MAQHQRFSGRLPLLFGGPRWGVGLPCGDDDFWDGARIDQAHRTGIECLRRRFGDLAVLSGGVLFVVPLLAVRASFHPRGLSRRVSPPAAPDV